MTAGEVVCLPKGLGAFFPQAAITLQVEGGEHPFGRCQPPFPEPFGAGATTLVRWGLEDSRGPSPWKPLCAFGGCESNWDGLSGFPARWGGLD